MTPDTPTPARDALVERGIYVASKTKHAAKWKYIRDHDRYPIISSWLDESEPYATLDWDDLWRRCEREASRAGAFVLYAEEGDALRGAFMELGAALSHGVPVFFAGDPTALGNLARDSRIRQMPSVANALRAALAALSRSAPAEGERLALEAIAAIEAEASAHYTSGKGGWYTQRVLEDVLATCVIERNKLSRAAPAFDAPLTRFDAPAAQEGERERITRDEWGVSFPVRSKQGEHVRCTQHPDGLHVVGPHYSLVLPWDALAALRPSDAERERLERERDGLRLRPEYEAGRRADYDALCARLNAAEAEASRLRAALEEYCDLAPKLLRTAFRVASDAARLGTPPSEVRDILRVEIDGAVDRLNEIERRALAQPSAPVEDKETPNE